MPNRHTNEVTKIVTTTDKKRHLTDSPQQSIQDLTPQHHTQEKTTVRHTKYDVLITISAIIRKYKGNWCYASRQTTLDLLHHHHAVKIGYRQLGNHLADLRDAGLIKTYKRNHRRADGTFCLLTSARCLTITGCKYLIKRGVSWAKNHLQTLKRKYLPPEPGRPRQERPPSHQPEIQQDPGKNPFLDPRRRERLGLQPLPPFKPAKS